MSIKLSEIRFLLNLPAAKQVVGMLLLAVGALAGVIVYQNERIETAEAGKTKVIELCGNEKLAIQREYSDSVKAITDRHDREKTQMFAAQVKRLEEREKEMDATLTTANQTIRIQNRTKAKLQKITSKVQNIVK